MHFSAGGTTVCVVMAHSQMLYSNCADCFHCPRHAFKRYRPCSV